MLLKVPFDFDTWSRKDNIENKIKKVKLPEPKIHKPLLLISDSYTISSNILHLKIKEKSVYYITYRKTLDKN